MSLATAKPKYYWDACIWITLIKDRQSERGQSCEYILELAKQGKCEIWTSSFCLAEVYKRKCGSEKVGIDEDSDRYFEDLVEQEFIKKVSVDVDVGKVARRVLRKFPKIGKPQDGVHVASCLLENIDELHTYDHEDLLKLNEKIERFDKKKLKICSPPPRPTENHEDQLDFLPNEKK